MNMRQLRLLLFASVIAAIIFFCCSISFNPKAIGYPRTTALESPEKKNIFFLKAHKCASSTVQNILLRFGYFRDLDFVLPEKGNYLGNPKNFNKNLIGSTLRTKSGKYNIFTHHTRYDVEAMREVMYDNATYITILREPADLFESLFQYYHFERNYHHSLKEILSNNSIASTIVRKSFVKLGPNQMVWDLGFNFVNPELDIHRFIDTIDNHFHLVMISEYMEASLVLLADLLNWPLENVAFLKINARLNSTKTLLSQEDKQVLRNINSFDVPLYDYFLEKLKNKIKDYGEDKMMSKVQELLRINTEWERKCVEATNQYGYAHTTSYEIRSGAPVECYYLTGRELDFTEEVRKWQRRRLGTANMLQALLRDDPVSYEDD